MKISFSNIPTFLLNYYFKSISNISWVYFGSNQSIQNKLQLFFANKGAEVEYGEQLYEVSQTTREDFVKWLDEVSVTYKNELGWMVSAPAVRNTYVSKLFLHLCYFKILRNLINAGIKLDYVFVDSPALFYLLEKSFPDQVVLAKWSLLFRSINYVNMGIRFLLRFFRYLLDFGFRFICAKLVFRNRCIDFFSEHKKIVLIRNFINEKFSITGGDFLETHYFPGIYKFLEEKKYVPVFLPFFIKPTNYLKFFNKVLKGKRNIFFPEEFLKISDYFFCFIYPFRLLFFALTSPPFENVDVNELLREDFLSNLTSAECLYASLLSRVARGTEKNKCDIAWILNWAENQAFEKGLIRGFRKVYPGIKVIAVQSFIVPPNYLSPIYSQQEEYYDILPQKVLALGPISKRMATKYIPHLDIEYSPAFRYTAITQAKLIRPEGRNLLVLLGIDVSNTLKILRFLLMIFHEVNFFQHIFVKLHPAFKYSKEEVERILDRSFPDLFQFVNDPISALFEKTFIGLCGASGTAVELVMNGIPVVTVGESHTLTMNYLEYKKDDDIWRICFSAKQVLEAIKHFYLMREASPEVFFEKANEFKKEFIAKPDKQYWENCCPDTRTVQ